MLNTLNVNLRYLEHVTAAMDAVTRPASKDDGRLALGTKERREQEEYFDSHDELNQEDDNV